MRRIDADALKAEWYRLNGINEEDCGARFVGYQEIARLIDHAPTVSADAVSREEYEETDGVIKIKKQSAKDVGEIKHIVIRSPNYTRYFYNESMPTSAEAVHKPDYSYEADMVKRLRQAVAVQGEWIHDGQNFKGGLDWCHCSECGAKTSVSGLSMYNFCPNCGAMMVEPLNREVEAEPKTGWIPCSERLPERGFGLHYLVTIKDGYGFKDDVYEAFFNKNGWLIGDNELADDEVIAWMPLPKPYREDGEV